VLAYGKHLCPIERRCGQMRSAHESCTLRGQEEVPAARSAGGDDEEAEKRSEESGEEEARSEGTGEVEWKEKGLCALRKVVNREPEPGGDGEAAGEVAPSSR
jgi:hypothetical protein